MEDYQIALEEAQKRGKFEGRVLQSLEDIKRILDEMTGKHVVQDAKIDRLNESKADRSDVEVLKNLVYRMAGMAAVLSTVTGVLISKFFV